MSARTPLASQNRSKMEVLVVLGRIRSIGGIRVWYVKRGYKVVPPGRVCEFPLLRYYESTSQHAPSSAVCGIT